MIAKLAAAVWKRAPVPRIKGTACRLCGYQVPAIGLPPDREMAWLESWEGDPCPTCVGIPAGMALTLALLWATNRP